MATTIRELRKRAKETGEAQVRFKIEIVTPKGSRIDLETDLPASLPHAKAALVRFLDSMLPHPTSKKKKKA